VRTPGQECSLVDRVITYIRTEIAQDRLRANQKIRENQIAKELKISRSPIREAFRALERDGLVKLIPGRGAYVVEVTPEDACEIFLLRSYFIGLAVRLATPRLKGADIWQYKKWIKELRRAAKLSDRQAFLDITSSIEQFFTHHSDSGRLRRFIEMIGNPCLKYRAFLTSVPGYMEEVVEFHMGIVKAIERKDASRAESLRRAISENGRRLIYHYFIGESNKGRKRPVRA
jgi:DNA-binding GntR family transcriptional regulator